MVRIDAKGNIVPDGPAATAPSAQQRRGMGSLHAPAVAGGGDVTRSSGGDVTPPDTGGQLRIHSDSFAFIAQALQIEHMRLDVPAFPALGWSRVTRIDAAVLVAVLGGGLLVGTVSGRGGPVLLLGLVCLALYIHVQQTGAPPPAAATVGRARR